MELVALAQDRRCVKATASNTESSRSHMIFTINFRATMKDGSTRNGKLNICDLAGSERLSKSGTHLIGVSLSYTLSMELIARCFIEVHLTLLRLRVLF
jgi:hypothetical protein